ncbi:phosphoesterase [Bacteroides uniformis]|uniref:calcineurin-like phosphoesterase C-terminal domain-containing protein n=1 Tax=Bacteroides uniformis TaxID=820 RepID=UPI000E488ADE|nr:calcineurin-like phosphoesterase family protein [Bacteroides uniformis]RGT16441.1 phosphoesterase [Bacteroides uniformis]RHE07853.1 phosphoesterase [Bacteroides uniformis]RHE09439.1 phosphoesterase [Bacteroides uniformis]
MNKKNIFYAALLLMAIGAEAKEIKGKVMADGKGLAKVVVTDGTAFALTSEDGSYMIDADEKAHFIYVVTPSGYMAPCNGGTPVFYKTLNENSHDFQLHRWGTVGGKYAMMAAADTQPRGENAFHRLETEAFPDLKQVGFEYMSQNIPAFAIFLGDILWDNLEMFPHIKQEIAKIQIPIYPVIGNHDHDKEVSDDDASAHLYRHFFGPTYYAFNAGKDYYIVLDNILYKGNKKYEVGLNDQQLNWVKSYLQYVPKGAHLFVCMHAPAYFYNENYKLGRVAELLDLFEGYKVDILSGHTHVQCNTQIRNNIREYNIASIGGAWWLWDGIYSKDGTPIGYQVFESGKNGIANYFKSLGHDRDYQFRYSPVGTVPGHEDELCVKVWNWDNRWKVEYYEDGKLKGEMKQYKGMDPDYDFFLQRKAVTEGKDMKERGRQANKNAYFFFSTKPSDKAKKIKIVVTDANGKSYEQSLEH